MSEEAAGDADAGDDADVEAGETKTVDELFSNDLYLVLGVMVGLYVVFTVLGLALGYSVNGLVNSLRQVTLLTAVFALVGLALNLHWGYTGLFNIGVAGFMAVGTYTYAMLTTAPTDAIPGLGLPAVVGVVGAMVVAGLVGAIAALPALRLRADYLAIVTIALSEIIRLTYLSIEWKTFTIFGLKMGTGSGRGISVTQDPDSVLVGLLVDNPVGGAIFDLVTAPFQALGVTTPVLEGWLYALILGVFVLGFYWFVSRVSNSPFGRVLKAIREDEDVARALGKNTQLFKIKVFVVGCALMGLGGILWRGRTGFISPEAFMPRVTFFVWIALIIGGAGSNTGSIIGAALFSGLLFEGPRLVANIFSSVFTFPTPPSTFAGAVGPLFSLDPTPLVSYTIGNISSLRLVLMGVVLIWMMHNRPDGLLGHRKETASTIDLSRPAGTSPAAAADGGDRDE